MNAPHRQRIAVPVQVWRHIDACVDNTIAVDAANGDLTSVAIGTSVREAGWRAIDAASHDVDGAGWPIGSAAMEIVLPREHWEWAALQVARWSAGESVGKSALRLIADGVVSSGSEQR
jgi:hypothetical protein